MRTFTRGLPSWHQPALAVATVVLAVAGLVAIPTADDDTESGGRTAEDISAGSRSDVDVEAGTSGDTATPGTDRLGAVEAPVAAPPGQPGAEPGGGGASTGGVTESEGSVGDACSAKGPSPGTALVATDRGVTPSTIRVGFALLDLGGASAVGLAVAGYSIEEQKRAYQVFVDDVNGRGGIGGRKIEPYYRASDPLDRDSSQALCIGFSRDDKVFAVLAQPGFRAHLCVAEQEQMLLMIDFAASDIFARSGNRIITNQQAGNRMMFGWIAELDRMGLLAGKKIGIVGDEDTANGDKQAVEQGVLPVLEQLGYSVTYRARLSADLNTGAGQIPVEVSQMRSAGVDAVLLVTNFVYATQFVQTADSQGWKPAYFTSDHNGLSGDDLMENMPPSFDGAVSVTVSRAPTRELREGLPEPAPNAPAASCTTERRTTTSPTATRAPSPTHAVRSVSSPRRRLQRARRSPGRHSQRPFRSSGVTPFRACSEAGSVQASSTTRTSSVPCGGPVHASVGSTQAPSAAPGSDAQAHPLGRPPAMTTASTPVRVIPTFG